MKGRAHMLYLRLQQRYQRSPFKLASVILEARLVPKKITEDLDDVDIERRLEALLDER